MPNSVSVFEVVVVLVMTAGVGVKDVVGLVIVARVGVEVCVPRLIASMDTKQRSL